MGTCVSRITNYCRLLPEAGPTPGQVLILEVYKKKSRSVSPHIYSRDVNK
jgi:hypothetical protein